MLKKVNIFKSTNPNCHLCPWLVRWREPDGRRPSRSFRTKAMATNYAHLIWSRLNDPQFSNVTTTAYRDLVEMYLLAKRADQLSENTLYQYTLVFEQFGELTGRPNSDQINLLMLDKFKSQFRKKSVATIKSKLRPLNALFNWAVARNFMAENPVPKLGKMREKKKSLTVWTQEQFAQVLDAFNTIDQGDQWKVLIHLAINGVARKGSLVKLTVSDIDFEHNAVRCYNAKNKEHRYAPLHDASMTLLTDYFHTLPAKQKKLFTCQFHRTTWNRMVEKARVPFLTFHHLRTCATTWLKQAGISDSVTASVLGHSAEVSRAHYTALDDIETRRVAITQLPL